MCKKVCTKCGIEKEANKEYFQADKKGLYGLKSICKECKNKELRDKRAYGIYPFTCTHCGKDYLAREKRYNKFCSRECSFEHMKTSEDVSCECCGNMFSKNKDKKINVCTSCLKENIQKNKVQKESNQLIKQFAKELKTALKNIKQQEKETKRFKDCTTCGRVFKGKSVQSKYCSDDCNRKHVNRMKEIYKGKRGKRIRANGDIDTDISLDRLIIKDNNTCYICNELCAVNDYTITNEGHYIVGNMYPTIDHVTAIANGGTHTWNNIRLAHLICNSIKSDKVIV